MRIGFHVPFSGNLARLSTNIKKTKGNVYQFYSRTYKGAREPEWTKKQLHQFYQFLLEDKISDGIMHAPLLYRLSGERVSSNLAEPNPRAVKEMIKDVGFAKEMLAPYYVVQPGYHKKRTMEAAVECCKEQLREIIETSEWKGTILVRNMVGGGTEVGGDLDVWKEIIDSHPQVQGALDFGRAFAFGYNWMSEAGEEAFLHRFTREDWWKDVELLYFNDSERFSGSKRDVPVALGQGSIDYRGYDNILRKDELKQKIWLTEYHKDASTQSLARKHLLAYQRSNNPFFY